MLFSRQQVSPSGDYFAEAQQDTQLVKLGQHQMQCSAAFASQINARLIDLLLHIEAWLALRLRPLAVEQVRDFLVLVAEQFGRPGPDGVRLNLRLTHAQIGLAIGKERVTVSGAMRRLRADGLVFEEASGHLLIDWKLAAASY